MNTRRLLLPILLSGCGLPAWGGGAPADPTRPPTAAPAATVARTGAVAAGARTAAAPASAAAPPAPPPVPLVQSIQTPRGGPASALVDGRIVHVGDSVSSGMVTAIDVDGLTVRGNAGAQRLWLLEAVSRPVPGTYLASPQPTPPATPAAASAAPPSPPPKAPVAALNGKQP